MIQDRAIVTMECEYETVPKLSTGTISNDVESTLSDLVKYSVIRSIARFVCNSWASC